MNFIERFKRYLNYLPLLVALLFSTVLKSEVYYWVGGTGNWSDTLHWQSQTGGLPTLNDDVVFNAASFPYANASVTIDVDADCRNMNWTNIIQPVSLQGNKSLDIFGSLILNSLITNEFTGDIFLKSALTGNLVNLSAVSLQSDLYFQGQGSWILVDSLILNDKTIYFDEGALNTLNYYIRCKSFIFGTGSTKVLMLGNSTVEIDGFNGQWKASSEVLFFGENSILRFSNPGLASVNTFDGGGLPYNKVLFKNDALLKGNNSFNYMVLNAGHTYKLMSGSTQTIQTELYARGCSGLIEIRATGNTQAKIAKPSGSLHVSFVALRSIGGEFQPGYYLIANNSIDRGNNSGCAIYETQRNMRWVNGTGMWTDTLHWSSLPAGPDADCLPLPFDNVTFDDNSFDGADTVMANAGFIRVNDMTWSTNKQPVFKGMGTDELTIFGSLQFASQLKNEYYGPVFFKDTLSGQTVKTSSVPFNGDVHFTGLNGSWLTTDSLVVNGVLYFTAGELNIGSGYVLCETFSSDSAYARHLILNDAKIVVDKSNPNPSWSLNSTQLQMEPGTSTITFTKSNSTMYNFGQNDLVFNDVIFEPIFHTNNLETKAPATAQFRKVIFASNGSIEGTNTFDTLSFSPGNYYDLQPGMTQTINHAIYPTGNCQGPVLLKSAIPGETAFLTKPADTLSVEYTAIYDIDVLGEATYIAYNSVDMGNNQGWDTIYSTAPGKLFWVGGNGDWDDPMHWALFSGGPGGECIPTPYDTVIFDQNSFDADGQKSMIRMNNAFAHDMHWVDVSDMPELDGTISSSVLRIYGSLFLNENMTFGFPGQVYFESRDTNEIIETKGVPFHNTNNNVHFLGPGGEWSLTGPLDLGIDLSNKNFIYYDYGDLVTQDNNIRCYSFYSNTQNERKFDPGNSFIHVKLNWLVNGTNFSLSPNHSVIQIDSGYFRQFYGNNLPYHNLLMFSDDLSQEVWTDHVDSLRFKKVVFLSDGLMKGQESYVLAEYVRFLKNGNVNEVTADPMNIYSIDSLRFYGHGNIYGNDTARWVRFDSTGLVNGFGDYQNLKFKKNGTIFGNNRFDTLYFTPAHTYILEGLATQEIRQEFYMSGNNCHPVTILSSDETKSSVYKQNGEVVGEHLIMNNIKAVGGAYFDAGYFSENIDQSNDGWIFHEMPYSYNLGKDISMLEGDTVIICADYFNGNASTSYEWTNLETGELMGTDSCLMVTEKGDYVLTVMYDEGEGCVKQDTIFIGCHLGMDIAKQDVTCYGFSDGGIDTEITIGVEPITYSWYVNDVLYDTTQDLNNLTAGQYNFIIEDSLQCLSKGEVNISQPDSMELNYFKTDACYAIQNGTISLVTTGGTKPYDIIWSNDSVTPGISQLPPGEYSVSVTDFNGCPPVDTLVEIMELPEMVIDMTGDNLLCKDDSSGIIEINDVTGGTGNFVDYIWYKNDILLDMPPDLESLSAGVYSLIVNDDLGCEAIKTVELTEPDSLMLMLESTASQNELGAIDLTVTGGTEPYYFSWNTGAESEDIDPLGGGTYFVEVTDGNGCQKSGSLFVDVEYRIYAPTAFSPNGDSHNEVFELKGIGTDLRKYKLAIYNRYGQKVFFTENESEHWNGRLNNSGPELPPEVYTWIAELEFIGGKTATDSGNITLLR
ncbi:MAG: gliding motility-associated C-terminal domain-containing protein [Bacteroidales bacterium]|nr:gliding motility-associated C-terminal domain-containing protein [Bacteroidales bacterium]